MSICIRFVKDAAVYERFVTFVNVHELNALSLAAEIVRNLLELGLPLSQCVAQCYDGAAVMAGRCQGVQVHVREQCKSPCLYVHCHAHRLNLVLVSACNNNPRVVNALGLMEGIYSFIRASTVRHDLFTQCQRDEGNPVLSLP